MLVLLHHHLNKAVQCWVLELRVPPAQTVHFKKRGIGTVPCRLVQISLLSVMFSVLVGISMGMNASKPTEACQSFNVGWVRLQSAPSHPTDS